MINIKNKNISIKSLYRFTILSICSLGAFSCDASNMALYGARQAIEKQKRALEKITKEHARKIEEEYKNSMQKRINNIQDKIENIKKERENKKQKLNEIINDFNTKKYDASYVIDAIELFCREKNFDTKCGRINNNINKATDNLTSITYYNSSKNSMQSRLKTLYTELESQKGKQEKFDKKLDTIVGKLINDNIKNK